MKPQGTTLERLKAIQNLDGTENLTKGELIHAIRTEECTSMESSNLSRMTSGRTVDDAMETAEESNTTTTRGIDAPIEPFPN